MGDTPISDLFLAIAPHLKINDLPGKLINIDALDGAGNSTQANLVSLYLKNVKKKKIIQTAEPTKGVYGQLIRDILQNRRYLVPLALQQLFSVDRGDHLYNQGINEALSLGTWVVTARYSLSTLAFGISKNLPAWQLLAFNVDYPWPNLNFVLRVPVDECLTRIENRGTPQELFEKRETLEKVDQAYQDLAQRLPNVFLVDGMGDPPQVFERIKKIVEERLF